MPSPIAHSMVGLLIVHAPKEMRSGAVWLGLAIVAANAPDLDILAGFLSGSINAFHGGPSHSIGAALGFSTIATLALRRQRCRSALVFGVAFSIYLSHVLLDMPCEPSPTRPGLPLFWPVTSEGFLFSWRPFLGIAHGTPHGGALDFFSELFSIGNFKAIAFEIAVFAPALWLAYGGWRAAPWLPKRNVGAASGAEPPESD
jgi:hypothetical protein